MAVTYLTQWAWMVKFKKITLLLPFYIALAFIFSSFKKKIVFVCLFVWWSVCFFVFLIFFVLHFLLLCFCFCVGFCFSFYVLQAHSTLKCWSCFNIMLKQIPFFSFFTKSCKMTFSYLVVDIFKNEANNENKNILLRVCILA